MENPTEYAVLGGSIEVRRRGGGGKSLFGSFPYGKMATCARIRAGSARNGSAPRAFSFALRENREVHLLSGHDLRVNPWPQSAPDRSV